MTNSVAVSPALAELFTENDMIGSIAHVAYHLGRSDKSARLHVVRGAELLPKREATPENLIAPSPRAPHNDTY
jgi:hypothetical protein